MAINTGIYITGLGQSFHQESVEKYAERIKNELSFTTTGTKYDLKAEKVYYSSDKQSTCVSIIKSDGNSESVVYKLYEFQYHEILTEKFQHRNILSKSLILLMLVIKKFPQILLRIFSSDNFNRPYQTFYAFLILLIISFAIIFLIPASIDMIPGISITHTVNEIFGYFGAEIDKDGWFWTRIAKLKEIAKVCVPITTLTLLLVPQSKTIVTTMATEFACVDRYMRNGEQSQIVLGNLDKLVEYIAETEINSKIHFHCYSFGSVIATDILFPIGTIPSQNIQTLATSLITIGNPYEFIKAYYPDFYKKRCTLGKSISVAITLPKL